MNFLNYFLMLLFTAILSINFPAAAAWTSQEKITEISNSIESEVIDLRHHFHQNPELSNREYETAEKITQYLENLDLLVETGIAHTGVVAILKGGKPGPVVALRADMDALPITEKTNLPYASIKRTNYNGKEVGVMHACGHDSHIAILLGAAKLLTSLRNEIPGTIKFIFQPAEEGAPTGEEGGADLMIKEGVLAGKHKPDAIFGLHAWPIRTGQIAYRTQGALAASDTFHIQITGKQTHGSSPWKGIDPITTAAQIITAIQTIPSRQLDITASPSVITIGTINGGRRHNIVPQSVSMTGTIRTFDKGVRAELLKRLKTTVTSIAESSGAKAELEIHSNSPVTYNDVALTKRMLPTLEQIIGSENVIQAPVIMGSEDFSYYQQEIPGLYFMLGVGEDGIAEEDMPTNHRPDFFVNDRALKIGVRAMSSLAIDYLTTSQEEAQR